MDSKLHQTDGDVNQGDTCQLRAALGSLSDFSSDFSQIIQLFFHSVSLSSRRPSGGRNPRPNPIPGGL